MGLGGFHMSKKKLYLLSFIITIACAFIPYPYGDKLESQHSTGFPAQVFDFYTIVKFQFGFQLLGFIFNFFFFYFFFRLLMKLSSKFFGKKNI
jgi:hypothetical protein